MKDYAILYQALYDYFYEHYLDDYSGYRVLKVFETLEDSFDRFACADARSSGREVIPNG